MTQATTAITARTPTSTMTAPRYERPGGALSRSGASVGGPAHLARVAPQPVIGVDPAALGRLGSFRAGPRALIGARFPLFGLLGRVAHGLTISTSAQEMPSREGPAVP